MLDDSTRMEPRGGREELRAALLRPALLHLRKAHGSAAVSQLLELAGLKESEVAHDSAWIPLACARRVLDGVVERLGESALVSQGAFAISPEVLGVRVRLLRHVRAPRDGYEYLVSSCSEHTRVGAYTLEKIGDTHATVVYTPFQDLELDQAHRCFCLHRQGELRAMPLLWGLPEAHLTEQACIAKGDLRCRYEISWQAPAALAPWTALAAAIGSGSAVALTGSWLAAAVTALLAGALGGAAGHFATRVRREATARTLERLRIIALEHGLEQRGQLLSQAGDLSHSVLGGKYRMLRSVGSGGIGTVYAAEHLGLGFQVAVKVLRGAAAVDASEVARLRREARVQMSIEHPNVVRTFDLDQMPDGTLYVVMELLRGVSLQDQLKRRRPLPSGFAIPVFLQACSALSAAHRLGIVHRDLKPGNVFLCDGGNVKVLDFGMSKLSGEQTLTQDGYTLGTPEYMSPEQCVGGAVDARSDVYAFGVLMYEALTGDLPFHGKTRQALLEHHQRSTPRPMRVARPDLDIPEELDRIVMACLKKQPSERPQTAQQLERLLAAVPPLAPGGVEYPQEATAVVSTRTPPLDGETP